MKDYILKKLKNETDNNEFQFCGVNLLSLINSKVGYLNNGRLLQQNGSYIPYSTYYCTALKNTKPVSQYSKPIPKPDENVDIFI